MFCRLLITTLLVVSVTASPLIARGGPVTLPLARHFNFTGSAKIVEIDRARARSLRTNALNGANLPSKRSVFPVPIANELVSYSVQAGIGTPPTTYTLLVDTGSALTWIGAENPYVRTSSSVATGGQVEEEEGGVSMFGAGFMDTITLGTMVVHNQFIGVAAEVSGFSGGDGILGIGPTILSEGVSNDPPGEIPTVTDNAFTQGLLTQHLVGFFFQPASSLFIADGELSFGGIDSGKINGTLRTVPITTTSPSSEFVGIDQQITYGPSFDIILSNTAGIVDTGTTLLLIASDAFSNYQAATGAVLDEITGLLRITPVQFANLRSLFFNIGGERFEFTNNAQLWPRSLNGAIGGNPNDIYLIVADIGTPSGTGFDFVNGFVFLERFYTVYDSATPSFSIGETIFTFAVSN